MQRTPDATFPGEELGALARFGRALASPVGVLVTMPLVVVGVGVAILMVGRDAMHTASDGQARRQLAEQAAQIEREVDFALDQAAPILDSLRGLVVGGAPAPIDRVGPHLYELAIARAGVAYVSISYPDGTFQGAYREAGRVDVQESRVTSGGPAGTDVRRYTVAAGVLAPLRDERTDYDPRRRDFYAAAVAAKARTWTRPYTFFKTHETGITCAEPVYGDDGALRGVLTVDFDVGALSEFIGAAPVPGARTLVFAADGTLLAFPSATAALAALPPRQGQPLHHSDLGDPAVTALFAALAARPPITELAYLDIQGGGGSGGGGGAFLASVVPIGGARAGATSPLAWYAATLVPESTLLGPSQALLRRSVVVSAIALAVAVALALALAWNVVRMRRAVASSRAAARAAEDRARELGSWRLVEKLGEGGMGEVWRAEHRLLVRQAAVKLMRADPRASTKDIADTRERFRREAQSLAAMRSRHTIALFDYGVSEDHAFFYVMELLDGLDLDRLVAAWGPQPAARVIHVLQQVCASLAEAHDVGLFHRDIKPANIFLCREADEIDVAKVLDFGIVHVVGAPIEAPAPVPAAPAVPAVPAATATATAPPSNPRMTELGAVLGTPGFMAPEQVRGLPVDGRSDLYALGCVGWLLLTGTEVFERAGGAHAIMFHHVMEPVPALAPRVPGWVPSALVDAITACLAKDPAERPPSARALAAALRAIEIPPEHAWLPGRAQAWWAEHVPRVEPHQVDATGRLLVPAGTRRRGVGGPGTDAEAPTIASLAPTIRG
jgi:serine/threonine protein kinase